MVGRCNADRVRKARKKQNVGVGAAQNDESNVRIVQGQINTEELKKAWAAGRADKYELNLEGKENIVVYVPYGKSGGAKADREITDAIVEAIKAEIESEFHRPTLIMGDFNAVPGSLRSVKDMLDTNQWIDVGACASWWGGEDESPTCQTRPQAKPTRIDGVLANNMAIPLIRGFR